MEIKIGTKRLKSDTFFDKGCIRRVHQLQRQSIKTVRLVSYINRKNLKECSVSNWKLIVKPSISD